MISFSAVEELEDSVVCTLVVACGVVGIVVGVERRSVYRKIMLGFNLYLS